MQHWSDAWNMNWCSFFARIAAADHWYLLMDFSFSMYLLASWSRVSNPTSHLTDANAAKCCAFVASRARGSKSVAVDAVDAETATSSPLSSLLSTPTIYAPVPFPLSSAIWLPERVRHHCCNGAAGICSRRCHLVPCSAGRQAIAEERMSHSGTQRNLKAWRSSGVEWQPRQPGAGNLSSASVINLRTLEVETLIKQDWGRASATANDYDRLQSLANTESHRSNRSDRMQAVAWRIVSHLE